MTKGTNGTWLNSAAFNGCSITWDVLNNNSILFGTNTPTCNTSSPPQFSPVIFWIFRYVSLLRLSSSMHPTSIDMESYQPSPQASAAFCYPSISLWEVNVGIDIATGNVTSVIELRPFPQNPFLSSLASTITGPPLNGRAYNGIKFNLTNPDNFVLIRQAATQLQLPAAIYQAAVQRSHGFVASFENNTFVGLSDTVYVS